MASFQERKIAGDAHEECVAWELTRRGWAVDAWGQGVLSNAVRFALRRIDSSLRWTPDLIAANGRRVALIDCKARMTSRTSHRHAGSSVAPTMLRTPRFNRQSSLAISTRSAEHPVCRGSDAR
ncbi:hypothetical protein [Streptantibioticus ferralitis]|uniref:PD-(D/E)XK endonuclease-like domain-containing protein n=1 Tax=Streptantibioticus ferralitis TaxID=236510 RepID=A0ABT5Z923_9ACTN|nr:hypothetical protein [Streptantibioticus ferralitis]MDF2260233.1 hypothetical protein [Streptantibioticus ferralitis]